MPDPIMAAAAWAGTYLIHSTLALCAAWVLDRVLLPGRAGAARELFWRSALLVPLASATLRPWTAGVGLASRAKELAIPRAGVRSVASLAGDAVASLTAAALAVWVLIAAASVIRLVIAHRRLRGGMRTRHPTPREEQRIRDAAGTGLPRVRISEELDVPTAFWKEIWLPARVFRELTLAQFGAVLAHEAAHIARRDPLWRWCAALVQRILFFQPLNTAAARRLRELSEYSCDDEAAARGGGVALASALALFATRVHGGPRATAPAALAGRESLTVERVRRLLESKPARQQRVPMLVRSAAPAVLAAVLSTLAPAFGGNAPVYTVSATDPAGRFTLTLSGGRVLAASVAGIPLARNRIHQQGKYVRLDDPSAAGLLVRLTGSGGIEWSPRRTSRAAP